MDYENFIIEVVNEFLAFPDCYEDISDLLNVTIDDYVGHNDIETNEKIVQEFAGGVYEAIQLYEMHLGKPKHLHKGTKQHFYQELAFISLFMKLYPQVKSMVNISTTKVSDDEKENEFNLNDVNDDINDMINETITNYYIYAVIS
jgi:hypothetical protein